MTITADVQSLEAGEFVELFELDCTSFGGDLLLFHGYINDGPILWQGKQYEPWAIDAEGFSRNGIGALPTPLLRVGNITTNAQGEQVVGVISSLCIAFDDLIGARITRRRTFAQYLDGKPEADPTQELPPEIWLVECKTAENREFVEFELKSAIDFEDQRLPARQINANFCPWVYRGAECNYTGSAMFDADDNPVIDPAKDKCGKRVSSCKARFGQWEVINFGGFPASDTLRGY